MFCNNPIYERPLGIFVTTKQTIGNAPSIFLVNNVLLVLFNVIFFENIIVEKKDPHLWTLIFIHGFSCRCCSSSSGGMMLCTQEKVALLAVYIERRGGGRL